LFGVNLLLVLTEKNRKRVKGKSSGSKFNLVFTRELFQGPGGSVSTKGGKEEETTVR